jgi:aryl-alcohol dehydrogenase-like predicted oxidoreductase
LDTIRPIAAAHEATLAQVIINWTTRQPGMDCVLVGARDEGQVMDNVGALAFVLSATDLETIRGSVANLVLVA